PFIEARRVWKNRTSDRRTGKIVKSCQFCLSRATGTTDTDTGCVVSSLRSNHAKSGLDVFGPPRGGQFGLGDGHGGRRTGRQIAPDWNGRPNAPRKGSEREHLLLFAKQR